MKSLILVGGGSHCKSVIDSLKLIPEWNIVGVLDVDKKIGTTVSGIKVIGRDEDLPQYYAAGIKHAFITVGGVGDNTLRLKLYKKIKAIGYLMPVLIDSTAVISSKAKIGEGTFIGKGAIVNVDAQVGKNSIINSGVIIEHDGNVASHTHIAPGTTLSGNVTIGEGTHIGTNSTIIQDINIGNNTLIGAGSVVVKDIGSYEKAYGNPCRVV